MWSCASVHFHSILLQMSVRAFEEAELDYEVSCPTTIENAGIRKNRTMKELESNPNFDLQKYFFIIETFFDRKIGFTEMNKKVLDELKIDPFLHMSFVFSSSVLNQVDPF